MDSTLEQARDFFLAGLAHYQAGRFEAAERQFTASLALMPGRISTLTNLGATRLKLGRFGEAADLLEEVLVREPENVEALGHRATALAELGQHADALAMTERLLALNPSHGAAWTLRGSLLRDLRRRTEAADAYRTAMEHGADRELMAYYIASLEGSEVPAAAPRHYVQQLFDGYAEGFEDHLVDVLKYRGPQVLVEGLARIRPRFDSALDLGCGTGLCGTVLRPITSRLVGVDLSANMVAQAKARGVYDEVLQADVADHLFASTERFDLVVAADVFVYVGALERVFAGAAKVLRPGGVFCFSVELESGEDLVLRPSRRYAHSRSYIERLAAANGFDMVSAVEQPVRNDQATPIPGLFAWLVRR